MESLLATDLKVLKLFRQCALAILSSGAQEDDAAKLLATFEDFDIRVVPESRGLKLVINNAPQEAFVDGRMITGLQDHLFAALRDIVYTVQNVEERLDLDTSEGLTDAVFQILRNADITRANTKPNLVICWGGKDKREGNIFVIRMHQDTEQVQNFLRGTCTTRKYDDGMGHPDKRFETLLDVR